jgi:chitin-binding protein
MLRYSASNAQGATLSQGVIDLMLEESTAGSDACACGNYDYTFPDNLKKL